MMDGRISRFHHGSRRKTKSRSFPRIFENIHVLPNYHTLVFEENKTTPFPCYITWLFEDSNYQPHWYYTIKKYIKKLWKNRCNSNCVKIQIYFQYNINNTLIKALTLTSYGLRKSFGSGKVYQTSLGSDSVVFQILHFLMSQTVKECIKYLSFVSN